MAADLAGVAALPRALNGGPDQPATEWNEVSGDKLCYWIRANDLRDKRFDRVWVLREGEHFREKSHYEDGDPNEE